VLAVSKSRVGHADARDSTVPVLDEGSKCVPRRPGGGTFGKYFDGIIGNFLHEGLKNGMPGSDIRTAAVPAVVDLCVMLLKQYGTISFEEAVKPTLALLDTGGPSWYIDTSDGSRIETGRNWQADLARTLRKLVEAEQKTKGNREVRLQAVADRFYRGDIADELEAWYISQGGFLRKRDLAAHRTYIEDPVSVDYRGYQVLKCGPWTQGPFLVGRAPLAARI
jgi:gamma-glutamyltranspeptidase/glutathione hydrolase